MAWKLLRLKPLKPFFFGKQTVFGNTNYASSEYFPQQTQIAGALRLYWMEQNRLMRVQKDGKYVPYEKKTEAINLVGDAGSDTFEGNDDLGKIQNISPMFILKVENDYVEDALFEIPFDVSTDRLAYPRRLDSINGKQATVLLENYDYKEGSHRGFGDKLFWDEYRYGRASENNIVEYNKIFSEQNQVGIALNEHKQVVDEMFYTKKSYSLESGYEFGLLVELDEEGLDDKDKLKKGYISIGADSSMFRLKVEDDLYRIEDHLVIRSFQSPDAEGNKIVLLSDSMLDSSIDSDAYFQLVPYSVPFRMMSNATDSRASYKTTEKLLVPKGSVYYFDEPNSLEEAKGAYAKMGFNRYLILD